MRKEVCLSCQTRIAPGTDFCPGCGMAISNFARNNHGWRYRFAMIGGKRRAPGEPSTFVKLKWLPFVFAVAMMIVTLASIPGPVGVGAAVVVAVVSLVACSMFQSHVAASIESEKRDRAS